MWKCHDNQNDSVRAARPEGHKRQTLRALCDGFATEM